MSVSSVRTEARPRAQAPLPIAVAAALVVVAVIAGLLVGGAFRSEPPPPVKPAHVSGAGVRLQLPSGWARGTAARLPGFERALWLRFQGAMWLRDPDQGLRAAVALLPAASPTLLPESLAAADEAPRRVRLRSGYDVWRYPLTYAGEPLTVYAAPTTKGIATLACVGTADPAACGPLASTVVVPGSRRFELGDRAAFFSGLPAVITRLEAARVKGQRALEDATNSTAQALAAADLAHAHETAATDLEVLRSPDESLSKATLDALTATASAYTALGAAAENRIPQPYAKAARAVAAADGDLRRTLTKVEAAAKSATVTAEPRSATTPAAADGPAAKGPGGADLTLLLLALFAFVGLCLAIRARRDGIPILSEQVRTGARVGARSLEAAAARVLASGRAVVLQNRERGEVFRRRDGRRLPVGGEEALSSTPELLALERRVVEQALESRGTPRGSGRVPLGIGRRSRGARPRRG